jgi:hypothetical protein
VVPIVPIVLLAILAPATFVQKPAEPLSLQPHHATLSVRDVEASRRWCESVMGLSVQSHRKPKPEMEVYQMGASGCRIV